MSDLIEEDYSEVASTPYAEQYEWGLIGFRFYDGWMEDVRTCAAGLKDRVASERRAAGLPSGCNPAERLQKALISFHYEDKPPVSSRPSRWGRVFDIIRTGGYSELTRERRDNG